MRSAEPRTPIRPASTNIVVEAKNEALWIVCPTRVESTMRLSRSSSRPIHSRRSESISASMLVGRRRRPSTST